MGEVFLCRSPGARLVAVKVIHQKMAIDSASRGRFAREVEAAGRVSGAFTAPLIDADPYAPQPWFATSYIEGPSLAVAVGEEGPLPPVGVIGLAAGLAEGLKAVHQAGIVHRDLKPTNVMLAKDGPRLIDFGIAQVGDSTRLTQAGFASGSPGFMSPEQAAGWRVWPQADVFSLGMVLVFAATGEMHAWDGTPNEESIPGLRNLPAELRSLIVQCLAGDQAKRPTVSQILTVLNAAYPSALSQFDWSLATAFWRAPQVGATPDAASAGTPVTRAPTTPVSASTPPVGPEESDRDPTLTSAAPSPAANAAPEPPQAAKARPTRPRLDERWEARQRDKARGSNEHEVPPGTSGAARARPEPSQVAKVRLRRPYLDERWEARQQRKLREHGNRVATVSPARFATFIIVVALVIIVVRLVVTAHS